ncbi:MAG: UDP-N-acetylmuramoyl-L-alanyl-D-glutamate--2,6-diaminopimelate ligase [Candidatus Pacebacteria bacterium]|nr:UDP-N-acetylmuramoyl-L-alanyl-D-glutamate--2,6-diaminopimelate ligase [Candidatus Paceibacterota bacterium]MCD8508355.1 UDP-N-acetylmuramoyl-L-alanyl-D-glutamate--2,6-diaminopimelate ligase [Candidatus Paceibacterota bacterium]MCD8528368.1 UDP-N-acetylmuramoyl-L-alanyl-D-glutamate--2,6-diaminopimelate ligase [Candidatus Paceibacterota bacterium]MCD8563667.1 UDP-N-acetylmuramoyl-L-alanyl-D-glutamate--2,6-diaminopimelate ligase [Candidatus Paceibacterota bacterium]
MLLADILHNQSYTYAEGALDRDVTDLCLRASDIEPGAAYIAVRGTQHDGHDFIQQALDRGATAILCQELPAQREPHIAYVVVDDLAQRIGFFASNFFGNPSAELVVMGVTGTNGKTTTATLAYQLLTALGYQTGLLSTVVNIIGTEEIPATHTTPDAISVHRFFRRMRDAGCTHVCMEVSSHALVQGRVAGIHFSCGVFTNITHDHLDYHGTFENYIQAKQMLFNLLPENAYAVVNRDNPHTYRMIEHARAKCVYYGIGETDRDTAYDHLYTGSITEHSFEGTTLSIEGHMVKTHLIGMFNAYNIMGLYAMARVLGCDPSRVREILPTLIPPSGRFEYYHAHNVIGVIDYAHTPDALENVLTTLQAIRTTGQRIITVVGCGGDRDKEKRAPMARTAETYSDYVVLTSDNPRSEDPLIILEDMKEGIIDHEKVAVITDRKEAIHTARTYAHQGDIILIAGKGHESYQEIQGVKYPFSDKEVFLG